MVHRIRANDSSSIEVASGTAFSDGGPDTTLIVDAGAYLISDNGVGAERRRQGGFQHRAQGPTSCCTAPISFCRSSERPSF
jgi:hypothetical protein